MKAAKTLQIVSLAFGAIYLVGVIIYFIYVSASASATLGAMGLGAYNSIAQYSIGYVIGLMVPSLVLTAIGVVLNIVGIVKPSIPWLALGAAIAYLIALFLSYGSYWMGNIVPLILSIIAFVLLLKNKPAKEDTVESVVEVEVKPSAEEQAND